MKQTEAATLDASMQGLCSHRRAGKLNTERCPLYDVYKIKKLKVQCFQHLFFGSNSLELRSLKWKCSGCLSFGSQLTVEVGASESDQGLARGFPVDGFQDSTCSFQRRSGKPGFCSSGL